MKLEKLPKGSLVVVDDDDDDDDVKSPNGSLVVVFATGTGLSDLSAGGGANRPFLSPGGGANRPPLLLLVLTFFSFF